MDQWDRELVQCLTVKPLFFVRYIDDLLFIFPDQGAANEAIAVMNSLRRNIQITEYCIGQSVHFLDVSLEFLPFTPALQLCLPFEPDMDETVIRISLYRKATDLIALLHFNSSHIWPIKFNTLYGQCVRIIRLSNDLRTAGQNIYILLAVMQRFRALPARTLRRIRCKIIHTVARSLVCGSHGYSKSPSPPSCNVRRNLLAIPMNIDHGMFKKSLMSLMDTLSVREQSYVGKCMVTSTQHKKLGMLLFK